ncbi:urea transporter [Candidatus Daviesbacteria bacterium]|nr:urea transporter [Candidatus Daviesbacteria bacterium]
MVYLQILLKAFSQVFFQENIYLGALIILGLLIASPIALLLALVGDISSLITANFLNVQKEAFTSGHYAFNGILIGTAISFYIKDLPLALVLTILASMLATLFYHQLFKNNLTPLASPFILITWGVLFLAKFIHF